MSDNLQLVLRAVQEFDISVSRAVELIEIDQKGEFNYDLLPYGAGTQAIFGFDEVPVQKYKELLAERNTLAAKLKDAEHDRDEFRRVMNGFAEKMAELEGQEPAAWARKWFIDGEPPKKEKNAAGHAHLPAAFKFLPVSPSRIMKDDRPLYCARPVPAKESFVTVTTDDTGRCVMVSRQDEDHRILSVIWEAKDTPTESVNARLLDALKLAECAYRKNVVNKGEPSSVLEAMQAAIIAAEAQRPTDYSSTVGRAWARFYGAFGDGPDAPYPGMIAAFETHYGQSFRDKEWRTEAACWAAAWSKATARAAATLAARGEEK